MGLLEFYYFSILNFIEILQVDITFFLFLFFQVDILAAFLSSQDPISPASETSECPS